ncbi:MAG: DUF4199 family protein [Flavobacteriales bacterium Tduv]
MVFITLVVFFVVYFLFRDGDYFLASVHANAFFVTPLYALFALYITYRVRGRCSSFPLLQSFGIPFLTLCIGGILSLGVIFLFFNFWGQDAVDILQEGMVRNWFERYKTKMVREHGLLAYEGRVAAIHSGNFFNPWVFLIYSLLCISYYFVLSVLIGLFFRKPG